MNEIEELKTAIRTLLGYVLESDIEDDHNWQPEQYEGQYTDFAGVASVEGRILKSELDDIKKLVE